MTETASSSPRADGGLRQLGVFLINFLRHPLAVGSFVPSSRFLVRRLLGAVDWSQVRTVVEYGPGVGTITGPLLRRLREDARLLAIETNGDFCRYLEKHLRDPRLIVAHRSAEAIVELLNEHRLPPAEVIVSGIPFTTLPPAVRARILEQTIRALDEHGRFLVYQYTRAVENLLRQHFLAVSRSVEWRNLWPMQFFICAQPHSPA